MNRLTLVPAPVFRETRTAPELQALLRDAMDANPDCRCALLSGEVYSLEPDDPDGATWQYSCIDCSRTPSPAACANAVNALMTDLQSRYDLALSDRQ